MGKEFLSIGEMARISGLTVKALRFYEKIGLLQPHHTDTATRYRYYSTEQLLQAEIIKAARFMNISPNDIKSILGSRNNDTLLAFIDRQKSEAEQKISELRRAADMMESVKNAVINARSIISTNGVYLRDIPQRRAVSVQLSGNTDERQILSKYAKLAMIIEEKKLTNLYETGIIFTKGANDEFHADSVFNTVADGETQGLQCIPAGRFACICYSRENAEIQQAKLSSYLNKRKRYPAIMLQADLLNDVFDYGNPYFELQVLLQDRN